MAALRRSSPEILLDPRLEEGIPFHAPPAAAACPAGGLEELPGGSQSPQHASSTAADSRRAKALHSTEGGGEKRASEAPMVASGPAQGTSLEHDGLQQPALRFPTEHSHPASDAPRRKEPAPQSGTAGCANQQDLGVLAQASKSLPVEPQAITASAQSHDAPGHDRADGAPDMDPQGGLSTEAASALEALEVRACDWREALMGAPEACARRGSMAAMSGSPCTGPACPPRARPRARMRLSAAGLRHS